MKETWYVETSLDGRPGGGPGQRWSMDMNGPHVGYDNRESAMAWALRLRAVYPHVRLRHDITTFEEITPS